MRRSLLSLVVAIFATAALFVAGPVQAAPVDLELVLAVDVSGSISASEFNLQKTGYVDAFKSASVQSAIASGRTVAATLVYWSSYNQQSQVVGWTLINSVASATAFADAINGTTRLYSGNTGVGEAITYSSGLFNNNGYEGTRLVLDVSGDGSDNSGHGANAAEVQAARNAAMALGITINGLPILGSEAGLLAYYTNNVIGGPNSFIVSADNYDDFGAAIETKIGREINPAVPEPATMFLLGSGLLGLAGFRRKIKE